MLFNWTFLHPKVTIETLGYIPQFLDEDDPNPAREQIDANYQHGGGWRSIGGFKLDENMCLIFPGDPISNPLAMTKLRDEMIYIYNHSWVLIIQPDGKWEVARID